MITKFPDGAELNCCVLKILQPKFILASLAIPAFLAPVIMIIL